MWLCQEWNSVKINLRPGMVVHDYNCSYSGGRDWEDLDWKQAQAKV
jgi:hypothetical protein